MGSWWSALRRKVRKITFLLQGRMARNRHAHAIFGEGGNVRWTATSNEIKNVMIVVREDSDAEDEHQRHVVGGHGDAFSFDGSGRICKQANALERAFYEAAYKEHAWPTRFLAPYYGLREGSDSVIELGDLEKGFTHPCVLDAKLGICTWDGDDPLLLQGWKL